MVKNSGYRYYTYHTPLNTCTANRAIKVTASPIVDCFKTFVCRYKYYKARVHLRLRLGLTMENWEK